MKEDLRSDMHLLSEDKCLIHSTNSKDRQAVLRFYGFPAEHWRHLRTTEPIESGFAAVKTRTRQTKGAGSRHASLAMGFKLILAAQSRWRRVNALELVQLARG